VPVPKTVVVLFEQWVALGVGIFFGALLTPSDPTPAYWATMAQVIPVVLLANVVERRVFVRPILPQDLGDKGVRRAIVIAFIISLSTVAAEMICLTHLSTDTHVGSWFGASLAMGVVAAHLWSVVSSVALLMLDAG
jgi:hypothetical protein